MITFSCASCGRSYSVKDELGGRRARCKQCGAMMAIPEAEIGLAPSSAFDDLPGPSAMPSARPPDDDEPPPPPRRPGKVRAPSPSSPSARSKGEEEPFATPEQIRRMGIGFVILGVGTIVLPLFGLQFRRVQDLPPGAMIPGGIGFAALGVVLLLISVAMGRSRAGGSVVGLLGKFALFGCLGVVGLIGLVVVLAIILPAIVGIRGGGGDRLAQAPAAAAPSAPAAASPVAPTTTDPAPEMVGVEFGPDGPFPTSFGAPRPPGAGPGGPPSGAFAPPPGVPMPPGFPPGAPPVGGGMAPSSGPAAPGRTPSAGGTIDDLLADLNSGDPSSIRLAAGRLRRPDDWPADRRPEVASALASLATGSGDQGIRDASARALTGWAGPEQLPALGQMLTDSHFVVRRQALEALGSIGSAEAAGVAASAADLEGRAVVQALRAIGPPAEPAALGLLGHPEWSVRMEICRLLGEIGGPTSVDPLRRATGDEHRLVQLQARQALDAIARRN